MLEENRVMAENAIQKFVYEHSSSSTLFIIQPIDFCNLNCSYCYLPGRRNYKVMDDSVCTKLVKTITSSKFGKNSTVCWHGGEPLTAGLKFYQNAFELFVKENTNNYSIKQSIQTNGIPINRKWIRLFRQYKVSVGISVDGPAFIHNRYRVNWNGDGSHEKVQRAINLMREMDYPYQGICVITDFSLDYPDEIFFYFLNNGFSHIGLNVEATLGANSKSSLFIGDDTRNNIIFKYRKFITRFFDLWFEHRDKIRVREFDKTMQDLIIGRRFKAKLRSDHLVQFGIITIGYDGDLYYFSPDLITGSPKNQKKFIIGSIFDVDDFDDVKADEKFQNIYQEINNGIENCSKFCEYFDICGGGEPADKLYGAGSFESTETLTCKLRKKVTSDMINEKITRVKLL